MRDVALEHVLLQKTVDNLELSDIYAGGAVGLNLLQLSRQVPPQSQGVSTWELANE